MNTALNQAIASLTNPGVEIGDALRGLFVVARRIKAENLATWLRDELDGYPDGVDTPGYRSAELPVELRFSGPMNSWHTVNVDLSDLPLELRPKTNEINLRQPVAELSALGVGESEPRMPLSLAWVTLCRQLGSEGRAPRMEMMVLESASFVLPRTYLRGLLDRVKSAALDLALDLEAVSADAGSQGGPTVESHAQLASAVTVHLNTIYANNSSVVVGDSNTTVQVNAGDLDGLLRAARSLLTEEGVEALNAALEADGGKPDEATRSVLDRVKSGSYLLASGIATNAAYAGLVDLVKQAFPGFS